MSSLNVDSNPHYGTEKRITLYRFISDQISSYHSKIINTNSKDATHGLDGLLNNDTNLNIEEHYTVIVRYTYQVFTLIYLLRFIFAPRIRELYDVKLITLNKCEKFLNLNGILKGKINEKIIKDNYEKVLILANLIKECTVTLSLIISKLASYSRQNSLAAALREIDKI
ncbi:transposase [Clostridium perfringens]|uniref:transposase n=1 Tax=Clostridium perfringens TaxID=1502 RepID=UPI001FA8A4FB